MFVPVDHILVIGHRNPDTDASASAFCYAEFLKHTGIYDAPVIAGVLGALTPQAQYVFEEAGVQPPLLVESLLPRVCDVATRNVRTLSSGDRFRDAIETLIRSDVSMLPVVDGQGKLCSVFSHRRDISQFLLGFDVVPLMGQLLTWEDLAGMPGSRAVGIQPGTGALSGQLRVAMDGSDAWKTELGKDDLLVCAGLAPVLSLSEGRFPRRLVVVSCKDGLDPDQVRMANARGAAVLEYRDSVLDFLFGLMAQVRMGAINLGTGPCVGEHDFLHDIEDVVNSSRHALPVLNDSGELAGVISRIDLLAPPRRKVILIDHFEAAQAAQGLEHAEILEIIDHHRVGDIETPNPVRVDCRPLGSSSTIVALRFLELNLQPDRAVAMLLLGGLVSDTLCLRSPTTTGTDRKVAAHLARIIGPSVDEFGLKVLRSGDDLLTADLRKIWNRDQKMFSIRNHTFSVAQLETVSLESIGADRLQLIRDLLAEDFARRGHLMSLLFLTDVLQGDSWVADFHQPVAGGVIRTCFGEVQPRPGWTLAKGVVSRKKQIVPPIMNALAECPI